MKKKQIICAAIALLIVAALLATAILRGQQRNLENGPVDRDETLESTLTVEESESLQTKETETETETEIETEEESTSKEETTEQTGTKQTEAKPPVKKKTTIVPQIQETTAYKAEITFPYELKDKKLIVDDIRLYKGIYVEDGTDTEVDNVAAVILRNENEQAMEAVKLTVVQGDRTLEFIAADIPAGASVIAMESGKQKFLEDACTECTAQVAYLDEFPMAEDKIKITENENSTLTVENISGEDIPCVRIFYKYYLEDENAYVGGITYNVKLNDFKKDSSLNITPSHYAGKKSKVVMVRTYDEEQ